MSITTIAAGWSQWTPRLQSILRIVAAFLYLFHGTMKLFAWPAGITPDGATVQLMSQVGLAGILEVGGGILLISNFTVAASCQEGRRPSLENAAPPADAQPLFDLLAQLLREHGIHLELGRFGAMMQVELVNDGPVTFLLRSPR